MYPAKITLRIYTSFFILTDAVSCISITYDILIYYVYVCMYKYLLSIRIVNELMILPNMYKYNILRIMYVAYIEYYYSKFDM